MSDTPKTDALVKGHKAEHYDLRIKKLWDKQHAVRQAEELLAHAQQMERDREELLAALRELEESAAKMLMPHDYSNHIEPGCPVCDALTKARDLLAKHAPKVTA